MKWLARDFVYDRRSHTIVLFVTVAVFPLDAMANSMAPALPLVSIAGWLAMPMIVLVEALLYRHKQMNNPVRLSLYANMVSGVIGLLLALVTAPIMIGPTIEDAPLIVHVIGILFTMFAVGLHWWLSSNAEYRFSRWHGLWKDTPMSLDLVYRVNAVSYALIVLSLCVLRFMR